MHNTRTLEAKHIRQLIKRDKQNSQQVDQYFIDAMTVISHHLNEFYQEYATDTGLTLAQVNQSVNAWDIQHYMQAIKTIMSNVQPDDKLSQQLQSLQAKALVDKRSMLSAMVTSGILAASVRTKNYAQNELPKQYFNELSYRSPQNIIKGLNQPQSVNDNQAEFENRLSVHTDNAVSRANETLNTALASGLSQSDMDRLTTVQSQQDKRLDKNISSAVNNMVSGMIGALNYQAINNTTIGANTAYQAVDNANDTKVYKKWQTQEDDKVCDICAPMDNNIYTVDDCPTPEEDTHNNCRCTTPYCDADGNLLDVYPDE